MEPGFVSLRLAVLGTRLLWDSGPAGCCPVAFSRCIPVWCISVLHCDQEESLKAVAFWRRSSALDCTVLFVSWQFGLGVSEVMPARLQLWEGAEVISDPRNRGLVVQLVQVAQCTAVGGLFRYREGCPCGTCRSCFLLFHAHLLPRPYLHLLLLVAGSWWQRLVMCPCPAQHTPLLSSHCSRNSALWLMARIAFG